MNPALLNASNLIHIIQLTQQLAIVRYFKDKGAISIDSAITPNEDELRKKSSYDFRKLSFIKHAGSDKYYFDKQIYNKDIRTGLVLGVITVIAIVLITTIFMIIFY